MNHCSNLYLLSTLACNLSECLNKEELEILATDLTTLGYMIESLIARKSACKDN